MKQLASHSTCTMRSWVNIPVIDTSPCSANAFSRARCLAWFRAFSTFLAFLLESGANGPLVGKITLLKAVPLGFLAIPAVALRLCTLVLFALRLDLLGTLQFATEGMLAACGLYFVVWPSLHAIENNICVVFLHQ